MERRRRGFTAGVDRAWVACGAGRQGATGCGRASSTGGVQHGGFRGRGCAGFQHGGFQQSTRRPATAASSTAASSGTWRPEPRLPAMAASRTRPDAPPDFIQTRNFHTRRAAISKHGIVIIRMRQRLFSNVIPAIFGRGTSVLRHGMDR